MSNKVGQKASIDINFMQEKTGRMIAEDQTVRNMADAICACTDSIRFIPSEDSEIFENARLFKAEIRLSLPSGDTEWLVFETPPATEENPLYVVWGTDIVKSDTNNIQYTLWEDAEWDGDGAQPIINPNRPLKDLPETQPLSQLFNSTLAEPVVTSSVEVDLDTVYGSQDPGLFGGPAGGSASGLRFIICLPDTKYALQLTNADGQTANITVKSAFIEGLFPNIYARANA